ncbi:MAG: hypothetical protein JST30_01940 [Armatimonadetes bacterium]|nr:hypothetical protein [Armatimonadota bacterium]
MTPLQSALAGQYFAALQMLGQTIEECPDDVWLSGVNPRLYWRIVYHTLYYTDLYLHACPDEFSPWPDHDPQVPPLWNPPQDLPPYSKDQLASYCADVRKRVQPRIEALDLDESDCRFPYYKGLSRLDHQLVNLRHLSGHVGQLSEILMGHGIDTAWIGKRAR